MMSLTINNNLMAVNTSGNLNVHYGNLQTSVRRLSSGLRINSSADDAAGLAIRELMRADIAALGMGVRNANDAISMIQVADGALAVIDEKLIRMKELAEQAATGTYTSDQRLMIDSEFQAMAREIDRIARATDFNGLHLLDGNLSGRHNGSGLEASGAMKIHFGTGNDSAEDYYYVTIGDCTTAGLGLGTASGGSASENPSQTLLGEMQYDAIGFGPPFSDLNDYVTNVVTYTNANKPPKTIIELGLVSGTWYCGGIKPGNEYQNTMLLIPAGTKNLVINEIGSAYGGTADNDIQLFTRDGKHLAGTSPLPAYPNAIPGQPVDLASNCTDMGFTLDMYDASFINQGPANYDEGATVMVTNYNGMNIAFSGANPDYPVCRYEVLAIDRVTEDLVVWLPGAAGSIFQYFGDTSEVGKTPAAAPEALVSIATQEKAQKALTRIDGAIASKDMVRAHLGAMQNRLENTVSNLTIQSENLQAAESRISDADVAIEMTKFVRSQILTQSAVAMLGQANSLPQMAMHLLGQN